MKWEPNRTVCVMSEDGAILQTAKQAMKQLENKVARGENVPMSEFTKILIWEATNLKLNFIQKIRKDKYKGWKIEGESND